MKIVAIIILSIFFHLITFSQNYNDIDSFAIKAGPMATENVATIANTLTKPFPEKEQKARAIFTWIANNIVLDPKAIVSGDTRYNLPEKVIELRKGSGLAIANLYQEMASQAGIRCIVVEGYTRYSTADIEDQPVEINHSWNVVQLGQSPDKWYYVDASLAGSFPGNNFKSVTRHFASGYFFSPTPTFNLTHYPANGSWQLGRPWTKGAKDFLKMPLVYPLASNYGIQRFSPMDGSIKAKVGKAITFNITLKNKIPKTIELQTATGRKISNPVPIEFSTTETGIAFNYSFPTFGDYNLKILADGAPVIEYLLSVDDD